MKRRHWFMFGISLLAISCGAPKQLVLDVRQMEQENKKLKTEHAKMAAEVSQMSQTMQLMQEKIEILKLAVSSRPKAQPESPRVVKKKMVPVEKKPPEPVAEAFLPEAKAPSGPHLFLTNQDLDGKRVQEPMVSGKPSKPSPKDLEASHKYNEAFQKYEQKRYLEAIASLRAFVEEYPAHAYTDNAIFWIGESYFQRNAFQSALKEFQRIVVEFGDGTKVPDALLRSGTCYQELKQPTDAQRSFEEVMRLYPGSLAAKKAKRSIADLSSESSIGKKKL